MNLVNPRAHWYEISVQIDAVGQPIGASYSLFYEDQRMGKVVLNETEIGPFDTHQEIYALVVHQLWAEHGQHFSLWSVDTGVYEP